MSRSMSAARGAAVSVSLSMAAAATAGDCVPLWDTTIGQPGITDSYVSRFAEYDSGDGAGPQLYAVGAFFSVGFSPTPLIARWNGTAWQDVGGGLVDQFANDVHVHDGQLYVGGYFNGAGPAPGAPGSARLARWNGTSWSGLNAQLESPLNSVWALQSFQGDLFVGGNYTNIGGSGANYLARWDGRAFHAVGGPIAGAGINLIVLDMQVYDDGFGGGPALIAAGRFSSVDGVAASHIAKWDGRAWSPLGSGITGTQVLAMALFDDGSTGLPVLYVGGTFTAAGGQPASRIARWNGRNWGSLGLGDSNGVNNTVQAMTVFDDGSGGGPALYVAGNFTMAGGMPASRIAKWNGVSWSAVGSGFNNTAFAAYARDAGDHQELVLGGAFTTANGANANRVARIIGCEVDQAIPGDLDGNGIVNGVDLGILLSQWFAPGGGSADLNDDGTVNGIDLGILLANWTL